MFKTQQAWFLYLFNYFFVTWLHFSLEPWCIFLFVCQFFSFNMYIFLYSHWLQSLHPVHHFDSCITYFIKHFWNSYALIRLDIIKTFKYYIFREWGCGNWYDKNGLLTWQRRSFSKFSRTNVSGNLNVYYQSMKLTTHLLDQNLKHSKYLTFLTRNQTFRNVSNDKN